MSAALTEVAAARFMEPRPGGAWGRRARLFTLATGASQLAGALLVMTEHGDNGNPGLWLAGSGLLTALAAFVIPRSRRGKGALRSREGRRAEAERLALLRSLPLKARARYLQLMVPVRQVGVLLGRPVDPCTGAGAPRQLEHLLWLYLRLLTADHQLRLAGQGTDRAALEEEAEQLRTAMKEAEPDARRTVLRSRRAALELISQRLSTQAANTGRREEIACDLRRIEHHCSLFLEQAAHAGSMGEVSLLIGLDLTAGCGLEAFSEVSQQMLQESGQYYLRAEG